MSQNYLASRSSNLSSFNAIAMNYSTLTVSTLSGVSTLNVSRVITTSTIQVNSSMISLGASTNQVYVSSLSYGNFSTNTKWNTSMIDRLSTATIAMSANAQYQMTVSPSTTVSSIMYTSTLGQSWTTLSAATGLPSATATSYTAGAISGDGQYAALGAYGGYLYRTANSGATWTNTNPNTASLYAQIAFEGNANDVSGNGRTVNTFGSITYVPGIVGTRAINFVNASATDATQYIRIPWTGATNFSFSGWFNVQSLWGSFWSRIISAYNNGIELYVQNDAIVSCKFPTGGSNSVQLITYGKIALNTWYNYTLIFQTNAVCSFYMNNTLVGTITNTGGVGSFASETISLGCYNTFLADSFNGYMDDFKVYNSAITFTPMVPQNWSSTALSNTGQYMLATATGAGLYMSSNFGSTWTQVTGTLLSALWSAAQVSASGQYMLAYSTPVMVQPQLTGLASSGAALTTNPWQVNGITWTASASSVYNSTFPVSNAFNNSFATLNGWVSSTTSTYNSSGAYIGTTSTNIVNGSGAVLGEWLQIQSSVPLQMYSYNFASGDTAGNIPKVYYIIGSNDNVNWYIIQTVNFGATNPFNGALKVATSSPIIINQSGSQTMNGGNAVTFTPGTAATSTSAFIYFRLIVNSVFGTSLATELGEWYINFQAGGQTYSTNYGSTWNNGYALPTPTALSLSESGQYAIGANNSVPSAPVVYVTSNFLQGFSTGTSTTPTFQTPLGSGNVPVASAVSNTGQYMVIITNNVSGNNVYYSTNFGAYFAGLILGTTLLTSCAISYDGSYITVSNATTTWTLNNNSNGFSLALGNQAGYQNQGQNAIAIGNYAGYQNQTANSIILNASGPGALGTGLNAVAQGFYVAPIASYTASSSQTFSLLGYGTDNQVVQTGITSLYGANGYIGIGTANPRTHLDLNGNMIVNTTSTNAMLRFTNDSGINYIQSGSILADGSSAPLYFTSIYGQNKWMTIAANGNVGIGRTNPAYTLDVNGPINATGTIFATNTIALWMPSNGGASLFITDSQSSPGNGTTTYGRYFGLSGVIYQDFFGSCQWRGCSVVGTVSNANAMSISSGGNLYVSSNVGIGTVFPQAILHVHESPIVGDVSRKEAIRGTRNGTGGVQNNVSMALSYGPNTIAVNPYGVIDFKVNGLPDANNGYGYIPNVTVMSVVGNGRVGIGTTTPAYPLTVYGGTGLVYNAGGNNPYLGTPTIGVQNTSSYGAVCAWFQIDVIAGGALGTFSDIRIKNKIEHITNALEKINNIPVVQHDYVDKVKYPRACSVGVIAQDIVSIIPDAVSYEKEFIPNIMQIPSQCIRIDDYIKITCDVPMDITISDTLKLVLLSEEKQVSLLYLSPDKRTIHVPAWNDNHLDQLFVYGKQIDDFHIIDKAKLGILALGGVKELYQLLMKQQSQITDLIAQVKLLTDNK